jgi:hypothetical protein
MCVESSKIRRILLWRASDTDTQYGGLDVWLSKAVERYKRGVGGDGDAGNNAMYNAAYEESYGQ